MTMGLKAAVGAGVVVAAAGAFALNGTSDNKVADAFQSAREAELSGKGSDPELLRKLSKEMSSERFQREVLPRLKAAQSCAERSKAYGEYVSWARERELIGASDEPGSGFYDALEQHGLKGYDAATIEKCMQEAYAKCVQEHDVTQVSEMIELERLKQLTGVASGDAAQDERIDKCQRFELEFDAETDWGTGMYVPHARAMVPLKGTGIPLTYEGEAAPTIDIRLGTKDIGSCTASVSGVSAPSPVVIRRLIIDAEVPRDTAGERTGQPKYNRIDVLFHPATVVATYQMHCPDDEQQPPPWNFGGMYTAGFALPFEKEIVPNMPPYTYKLSFTPDEVARGRLFARKTIRRSADEVQTRLVLTLWHRPE